MVKKKLRNALALLATAVTVGSTPLAALAAPVQMEDGTIFDAEYYAQSNPDVVAALGTSSADMMWLHYQLRGRTEGRAPVAPATPAAATPATTPTPTPATANYQTLPVKSLQDERTTFWNYWIDLPAGQNGAGAGTQMLQVLNSGKNPALNSPLISTVAETHPISDLAGYYMLAASQEVYDKLYNVAKNTPTTDFVIGNEVNERKWNYVPYVDWDTYVMEYAKGFCNAYNAIKAANPNARVFVSIDQRWDANYPTSNPEYYHFIDGKDFLEKFNADVISIMGRNIDWGVAAHPHFVPLTWSRFWNYSGLPGGTVYQNLVKNNQFMDVTNSSLLTDFLQQPALRQPDGSVRPVVFSEITVAPQPDEASQAAALFVTYYATVTNPYVEAIIYARDASTNAYWGSTTQSMYQLMGTDPAAAKAYAESIIGRPVESLIR